MINFFFFFAWHYISRLKLKLKILQLLQQRNQSRNNPSLQIVVTSDNQQQPGKKSGENPNDRELQTYLREQNFLSLPESASLIRVWTEDVLQKQADQWTKTKNNCWLKTQVTHTEVVVEALVHEEPESVEPEKGSLWRWHFWLGHRRTFKKQDVSKACIIICSILR